MALVKRKVGKLPQRRADLYSEAVQVLLNWRREVDEPLDYREAIPQLEYLAYAMCDRGIQQIRQDEVIELFAQMREEFPKIHAAQTRTPEDFLRLLEARTGILIEAGHTRHLGRSVPVLEFRHLTFQEYLAARALVDGCFPNRDVGLSLADCVVPLAGRVSAVPSEGEEQEVAVVESWREALRLCVAICHDDDVDAVLLAILRPYEGELEWTQRARAIQAALCLADGPNASTETGEQIAQALAAQVGPHDGKGPVKTNLDKAAMELGGTRWAAPLVDSLIAEFFQRDVESRVDPGGLCGMVLAAAEPVDQVEGSTWLANQLVQLGDADECLAARAALCLMHLAYDGKWSRRAHTGSDTTIVPKLVEALLARLSGSGPMASAAAWALGWMRRNRAWKAQKTELEKIVRFVADPNCDAEAVRFVAWVLADDRVKAAVKPLMARLSDPHPLLRRDAVYALGRIGSERAVEALVTRLDDSDDGVRRAAAHALGEIKSKRAVEALVARLDDRDAEVRRAAADALGKIKSERAVEALVTRLDDGDAEVRRTALGSLARSLSDVDGKLLSIDLDGVTPFLDPREPINPGQVQRAAARLELSVEEVTRRYETLAERFGLHLERPAAE